MGIASAISCEPTTAVANGLTSRMVRDLKSVTTSGRLSLSLSQTRPDWAIPGMLHTDCARAIITNAANFLRRLDALQIGRRRRDVDSPLPIRRTPPRARLHALAYPFAYGVLWPPPPSHLDSAILGEF